MTLALSCQRPFQEFLQIPRKGPNCLLASGSLRAARELSGSRLAQARLEREEHHQHTEGRITIEAIRGMSGTAIPIPPPMT